MILPLRVLGSSSVKATAFGRAMGPSFLATCWRTSSASSGWGVAAPQDDVADDRLAGDGVGGTDHGGLGDRRVVDERDSTSVVEMRWPETFMTSSTRPSSHR